MVYEPGDGLGPEHREHRKVFLGASVVLDERGGLGTSVNAVPHEDSRIIDKRAVHARELLPCLPI